MWQANNRKNWANLAINNNEFTEQYVVEKFN